MAMTSAAARDRLRAIIGYTSIVVVSVLIAAAVNMKASQDYRSAVTRYRQMSQEKVEQQAAQPRTKKKRPGKKSRKLLLWHKRKRLPRWKSTNTAP